MIVLMQKIGISVIQSCVIGGVVNGIYLFVLLGSIGVCKDVWDEILVKQLDYWYMFCNFVEIFFRLDEYL